MAVSALQGTFHSTAFRFRDERLLSDARRVNWDLDPHFPKAPDGFPEGVTLQLRKEADYAKLVTLRDLVTYLARKLPKG